MEYLGNLPEEVWTMILARMFRVDILTLLKAGFFPEKFVSNKIVNEEFLSVLRHLHQYLSPSDFAALRLLNRKCNTLVEILLNEVEKSSDNMSLCRLTCFENIYKLSGCLDSQRDKSLQNVIPYVLLRNRAISIKVDVDENDKTIRQYLNKYGSIVAKIRINIRGNLIRRVRQKIWDYLSYTPNTILVELIVEIYVNSISEIIEVEQRAFECHEIPVELFLPKTKQLLISAKYIGGFSTIFTQCLGFYFFKLFIGQFRQLITLKVPDFYMNLSLNQLWLMSSNLSELRVVLSSFFSILNLSNVERLKLKKLTLDVHNHFEKLFIVFETNPYTMVHVLNELNNFRKTLTHLHIKYHGRVRYNVLPVHYIPKLWHKDGLHMTKLRQITITNGILSSTFAALQELPDLETIHIIMEEPIPPAKIVGTSESKAMVWKYLKSLRVFIYEAKGIRKTYMVEDMRRNSDAQLSWFDWCLQLPSELCWFVLEFWPQILASVFLHFWLEKLLRHEAEELLIEGRTFGNLF